MAITINVNDLTLCHRGSGGVTHNTLPDVCKTPGKGVPKPYENEAYSKDLAKGSASVFADGGNSIANFGSEFATSVLDEGGGMGGVLSGTNLAEADWISHSFDVFIEGKPACRLTDKMFMNHHNTVNLAGLCQDDLGDEEMEKYLCDIAKKCWETHKPDGPSPLGKGQQYQHCVNKKIRQDWYKGGYPKPDSPVWSETPFDRATGDLIHSKADPHLPTSNYIRPNSRRFDIMWWDKCGNLKTFDMKFPTDPSGDGNIDPERRDDYHDMTEKLTGDKEDFDEFNVKKRCLDAKVTAPAAEPAPAPVADPANGADPAPLPPPPPPAPKPGGQEIQSVTITGKKDWSAGEIALGVLTGLAAVAALVTGAAELAAFGALLFGLAAS